MKVTVIDICVKDSDHEISREEAHKLLQSIVRDFSRPSAVVVP